MAWEHRPHTMNHELLKAVSTGDADLLAQVLGVWSAATVAYAEEGGDESYSCLEGVTAEGSSALHIAASRGYLELVVMICTQNISLIKARNNLLDTPLICAARAGHADVVDYIIRRAYSSDNHHQEAAAGLVLGDEDEAPPPVNPVLEARNSSGATAMHEAVSNGHESVLEKLMSWDTRLAAVVDGRGVSPLYMAVASNRADMVDVLIRESHEGVKSPASYAGLDGQTALHAAVYAGNAEEMSESLQRWEPTLAEKADSSGRTALHLAALRGKTQVVKRLLLRNSLLAYIPDDDGLFPVHAAAIEGDTKVIREIIKICPSCDELVDKKQRNILHCAVERGRVMSVLHICINTKFVRMMNEGDVDGNTPLHLAIMHGHQLIFYILMMNTSVDVTVMNNAGLTPCDVAAYKFSSDYTYSLAMSFFMYISLRLCGAPHSYQGRKLINGPLLEDKREESSYYTDVSQSLLYISGFIAAASFAAALAVPGGYTAEGENAGMPVIAGTQGLLRFVEGNALSFYCSTFATCFLVRGSLTSTKHYTRGSRVYLGIWAVLVWYAVLFMLHAFASVVRLSLNPPNCREHFVFYSSVLVDVVVAFLALLWPMLFFVFPLFLRVARQLRKRRLSWQRMCRALFTGLLATCYVYAVIDVLKSIVEDGLSPMEESCKLNQSGSWEWLVSYGKILFASQGDELFSTPDLKISKIHPGLASSDSGSIF